MAPEEEQFLKDHRFCVITTLRRSGAPFATPVYYFYDEGNHLRVHHQDPLQDRPHAQRPKGFAMCAARGATVNTYRSRAPLVISEEELEPRTRRIFSLFSSNFRDDFSTMLEDQHRQLIVVTPTEVTSRLIVPSAR